MVNYEKLYCELLSAVVSAIGALQEAVDDTGEKFLFDTAGPREPDRNTTRGWLDPKAIQELLRRADEMDAQKQREEQPEQTD